MEKIIRGHCVIPGKSKGKIVVTYQTIAFAGGVDPKTGNINDPKHELFGQSVSKKVLAFPYGKGSSASSLFLLELARIGKSPAAIINIRTEPILAAGSILSKHFYGKEIPILTLNEKGFHVLKTGQRVLVNASKGYLTILR